MITRVDHAIIIVRNLDTAIADYSAVGLSISPATAMPEFGTRSAFISFGQQYLELTDVPDAAVARQSFIGAAYADFVAQTEGLATFALATDDLRADTARLKAQGSLIGDPLPFRTYSLALFPFDQTALPFLVQYATDRAIAASDNSLPVTGIDSVMVAVHNLHEGHVLYRQNLGLDVDDNNIAMLPQGGAITLYESSGPSGVHRVRLRTSDIIHTRDYLAKHHIPFEQRLHNGKPELWLDKGRTSQAQISLI